jgi:hypothetical protein
MAFEQMVCALVEPTIMAATSRKKSRMVLACAYVLRFDTTRYPESPFRIWNARPGRLAGRLKSHPPEHNHTCGSLLVSPKRPRSIAQQVTSLSSPSTF